MAERARLDNIAPVFVSPDPKRTAQYYRDLLGFEIVEHYDAPEAFAALYRDGVEIIVVQSKRGRVEPNMARYGAGFDAYIDPDSPEAVDSLFREVKEKGARIVAEPVMTAYGCYEFVIEDIDGRLIGIGHIRDKDVFFSGKQPG